MEAPSSRRGMLPALAPVMGAGRARTQTQTLQQTQAQQQTQTHVQTQVQTQTPGARAAGREDAKRARGDKFSAVGIADPAASAAGSGGARKPSASASFAHIFFNRRPLELLKRTSSLLTGGNSAGRSSNSNSNSNSSSFGSTAPVAAAPEAERRVLGGSAVAVTPNETRTSSGDATTGVLRVHSLHPPHPTRVAPQTEPHIEPKPPLSSTSRLHHPPSLHARWNRQRDRAPSPSPLPRAVPCARDVLQSAPAELTDFEKREILMYDQVHFYSKLSVKKQRRGGRIVNALPTHGDDEPIEDEPLASDCGTPPVEHNDGFDDERGDYLVLVQDHLAYRFEVQRALGRGSFGQVVGCLDHRTQRQVAVKIIRNRAKYAEQAMLEVQLLTQLARADAPDRSHVVRMVECVRFRNHVCIVFELLGVNLYDFLKLRYFQGLEMPQVRRIGKQLSEALVALQDLDIIHCDLKPENVLIKHTPDGSSSSSSRAIADQPIKEVTLIDFGSACIQSSGAMFTYVQSRFYRSPEVILGHAYTTAVDMWSLACILVELLTGHPIFAGENEREQLTCIMEVLGAPPLPFLLKCKRRRQFFDEVATAPGSSGSATTACDRLQFDPKPFVNSRGRRRNPGTRSLTAATHSEDTAFLAFLAKCLVWEPDQRLTPEQALQDPWLVNAE